MKRNKTIAIFSGYQLPHFGGVEKYTDNLSKELIKNGYRVIIISSNYDFQKDVIKEENDILKLLLPVRELFVSRYPIIKKNNQYKEIMEVLDKEKIDTIIVNTRFYLTSLLGAKYGKKHHIPVYLIEHGSNHLTINNKVLDFCGIIYEHLLTMVIKKYVNYYYGVSQAACDWQKHFKINSNGIWYNAIADFTTNYKSKKRKNDNINIVYVGRVIQQKGLKRLCDAYNQLMKKYNNIKLTIVGDGEYLKYLQENYQNINFTGRLDFKDIIDIYDNTDIFVYAPVWPEGLPTSILEAGLMNCAVIASPQGGIKEVIKNNDTGLIINNEEELILSLEKLINDRKLRKELANNLYKLVKEKFVWNKTAKLIINDIEK